MQLRPLFAEFIGTAALVPTIVGSGIAVSRLSPKDDGLQLLMNAGATAAALYVLVTIFQPISGAHFNPIISLGDAALDHRHWRGVIAYDPAQISGVIAGATVANAMFSEATTISGQTRLTWEHTLAEMVATAGLVGTIFILTRTNRSHLATPVVALFIGAAYFATSSTSFANPAVTIGRIFTDTFAGIDPTGAVGFITAQIVGATIGTLVAGVLTKRPAGQREHTIAAV